jgi:hypothetical protein
MSIAGNLFEAIMPALYCRSDIFVIKNIRQSREKSILLGPGRDIPVFFLTLPANESSRIPRTTYLPERQGRQINDLTSPCS